MKLAAILALCCSCSAADAVSDVVTDIPPHCGLSWVDVYVPAGSTLYADGGWITRRDVTLGCSARSDDTNCVTSGGKLRVWARGEPAYRIGDNDPALDWSCVE